MDNRISTKAAEIRQETITASFKTNCLNMTLKFIKNDYQLSMEYPEMTIAEVDHLLSLIRHPLTNDFDIGFGFKSLYAPLWTAMKAMSLKYYIKMKTVEIKHDMTRLLLQKIPIKDTEEADLTTNKNIPVTSEVSHNNNIPQKVLSKKQILKMTRQQIINSVSSSFKNRCLQELLDFVSDQLKATIIFKDFTIDEVEFVRLMTTLLKSRKLKDMLSDDDLAILGKMKAYRGFKIKLDDRRAMASNLRDLTLIKVPNCGASQKASAAYRLLSAQPETTVVYEQNDSSSQSSCSEKSKIAASWSVGSSKQASRNSSVSEERSRNSSLQRIQFQNAGVFNKVPDKRNSQKQNTGITGRGRSKEKLPTSSRKARLLEALGVPLQNEMDESAAYRHLSTQPDATVVYRQNDSFNQFSSSEKSKTLNCFVPYSNQASRNSPVSREGSRNSAVQRIQFQCGGLINKELDENKSQKQNKVKKERGRSKELSSTSSRAKLLEALAVPLESEKGKRMMQLMGWEGGALGLRGEGITEPISLPLDRAQGAGLGHVCQKKNTKKTKSVPLSAGLSQGKNTQNINTVVAPLTRRNQGTVSQNMNAVLVPLEKPLGNKKTSSTFRLKLLRNILELISSDKNEISFLFCNINSKVKIFLKYCINSFNQRVNISLNTYEEQCLVKSIKEKLIQNLAITLYGSVVDFQIILTKTDTVPQLSLKRQLQLRKEVEISQPSLSCEVNGKQKETIGPQSVPKNIESKAQQYKIENVMAKTKSLINENQTTLVNRQYELDTENCDLISNSDFENVCIDTVGIDYISDCKSNKIKALRVIILKKILELVKGDKTKRVIVFEISINNREKELVSNLVSNVSKRHKFSFYSHMEANIYKDIMVYLLKERCLVNINVQDEIFILSKSIYKNRFINSALSKINLTLDEKEMKGDNTSFAASYVPTTGAQPTLTIGDQGDDTIKTKKDFEETNRDVKKEIITDENLNETDNRDITMDISKTDSLLDYDINKENSSDSNSIILDLGVSKEYCDKNALTLKEDLTKEFIVDLKEKENILEVDQNIVIKSEAKEEIYTSEFGKRYRSDSETDSQVPKKPKIEEIKKINIVDLKYPDESITETQVKSIQNLMSKQIDETHFLPLLKCYGIHNGALVYGCHGTESLHWLENIVSVASNLVKVIDCTENIENNKKHKMIVKMNVFIDENVEKLFKRIELYNSGLNTNMWNVVDVQRLSDYLLITIDVDNESFRFICDRNFSLFAGLDMAEFSNVWI